MRSLSKNGIMMDMVQLDNEQINVLNEKFESKHPVEILKWIDEAFPTGKIGLATGFGAEGAALVDMLVSVNKKIPVFYLDTEVLFPETYKLRDDIESKYGIKLIRHATEISLERQVELHGPNLWERDPDLCCSIRKVEPLREGLENYDGWITAIRREQSQSRANTKIIDWDRKFGLLKINPLAAWTKKQVWGYIMDHGVPYNSLYDSGYSSIGCIYCTTPIGAGEDERAGRWRGFQKKECGLHVDTTAISIQTELRSEEVSR